MGSSISFAAGDTTLVRLANGLSVLVIRDERFPLVSTRLYVHTGAAFESKEESGISHLLEHMVFKGTAERPKGEVARDVEAVGGYLNAYTSFDNTVYLTDMPAAHWKLGLDIVKDMAFSATLDPQDLASEKEVVVAELQRGKDSPSSRIFDILLAEALKDTPYERPIIGFENTIRSFTAEGMRAYISRRYQPQSMLLVVVGKIDPAAVTAEAERLFGGLKDTVDLRPPRVIDPASLPDRGLSVTVQPGPWNKVYLGLALPAPAERDLHSLTYDVLAYLLAGDPSSHLYRKYKYEKQLVHSISAHNMSFERLGLFYIGVELDADKLEPFWKEFCADLARLDVSRFKPEELAAAKLNLEDGIQKSKETLGGLASWKGHLQFFLGGQEAEANMLSVLRRIDTAQLKEAAAMLFSRYPAVAALTPQQAAPLDLAATLKNVWPAPKIAASVAAAGDKKGVEDIDLGQGRRLILLPDSTLPYIALDLARTGGDALAGEKQQGLASLAARVLTSGTAKRDNARIERFLADRAASLGAAADRQSFLVSLRCPTRFSNDLFALLREVLEQPAFSPEETAREKNNQIAAIRSAEDKPLGLLFRYLPPFLFPGHTYGTLKLGTDAGVDSFTPQDVRAFWARQSAEPWVMSVAGDFDRESVIGFARSLPPAKETPVTLKPPAWGKVRDLTLKLPDRRQAHLMLIFKTVPAAHPDAPGLELLESILGGQSGPLFTELRDRQALAYTVAAFSRTAQEAGYMAFYIGTEASKLEQADTGFLKVLKELRETTLPAAALERGINRMEADYYRERQSLASRSGEAAGLAVLGRPLSFNKDRIDKARAFKPEDIQRLVRQYLKPETAYKASVLP